MRKEGPLLLIGGNEDKQKDRRILTEIARQIGDGHLLLITAATNLPDELADEYRGIFRALGVRHIEPVDVRRREQAYDEALLKKVGGAAGVATAQTSPGAVAARCAVQEAPLPDSDDLAARIAALTARGAFWGAAALLTFLGVRFDDVLADYLLTNTAILPMTQPLYDTFARAGGDPDWIWLATKLVDLDAGPAEHDRGLGGLPTPFPRTSTDRSCCSGDRSGGGDGRGGRGRASRSRWPPSARRARCWRRSASRRPGSSPAACGRSRGGAAPASSARRSWR